jgi:hypothetical protein
VLVADDPFGYRYIVPIIDILKDIEEELGAPKADLPYSTQALIADLESLQTVQESESVMAMHDTAAGSYSKTTGRGDYTWSNNDNYAHQGSRPMIRNDSNLDPSSSVKLALAVVPFLLVLVEHHQNQSSELPKSNDKQNLEFLQELHGEIALLDIALRTSRQKLNIIEDAGPGTQRTQHMHGRNAHGFGYILNQLLKSLDNILSEGPLMMSWIRTVSVAEIGRTRRMG